MSGILDNVFLYGYSITLLEGGWLTIQLALTSLALSVALGLLAAFAKLSNSHIARSVASAYTTVVRGIPPLVMLLLIYFGLQVGVNGLAARFEFISHISIDPFTSGSLTLGFIIGAYMAETFRGAFLSVPIGQIEAAGAFGLSPVRTFTAVSGPQMLRHALPGFGNNWLVLLKETALVSIIGLNDIVRAAELAGGATRDPLTFYVAAALFYLVLTSLSLLLLLRAQRKVNIGYTSYITRR